MMPHTITQRLRGVIWRAQSGRRACWVLRMRTGHFSAFGGSVCTRYGPKPAVRRVWVGRGGPPSHFVPRMALFRSPTRAPPPELAPPPHCLTTFETLEPLSTPHAHRYPSFLSSLPALFLAAARACGFRVLGLSSQSLEPDRFHMIWSQVSSLVFRLTRLHDGEHTWHFQGRRRFREGPSHAHSRNSVHAAGQETQNQHHRGSAEYD